MADGSSPIRLNSKARRTLRRKLFADLWCGGGGTSTGAARAMRDLGVPFDLIAVNHWPVAIDTHTRNHPDGRHHCADLESARPIALVPEGRLDLLMASPTCTFHSRARGGKPVNDQQRMDPWHVVRWCTELRVSRILVENVPEFMDWGPCSLVTGRPIPARKGEYFRAWLKALKAIGYRVDYRVLCCADYGDATTRNRFFLIGRSDKGRLCWPEPSHAKLGATDLLSTRPRWRSAAEIIDWSIRGRSIFARKKPLKPNTIRRILAGAIRYAWPRPYVDALQALLDGTTPKLEYTRAEWIACAGSDPEPLLVRPAPDQIASSATDCSVPLPALTAGGGHASLVMAVGSGGAARPISEPVPTITAGGEGGASPQLITPLIMGVAGTAQAHPVADPLPTITTGGASSTHRPGNARPQLIEPIIVTRNNSERGRLARSTEEPLPTCTTAGGGFLAEPLIAPYYGGGSGLTSQPASLPLPSVTTKARFGVASPVVISTSNSNSMHAPRDADQPLRTITTAKGGDMAVASPFLVPNFGERPGQDPRTHGIDEPLPAITATGHQQLAEPFILPLTHGGERAVHGIDEPLRTVTGANRGELGLIEPTAELIEERYGLDILYRMLGWRELARGMSFDEPGCEYQFAGTGTEIVKQIGNAVPCRTAQALVAALMADAQQMARAA